jgi:hypothetical protein
LNKGKILTLTRFSYAPDRTEGVVIINNQAFYSLEQPWNHNRPYKSCIPDGLYSLEPFQSDKFGDTFALVNPALNVYKNSQDRKAGLDRFACLIHPANFVNQLQGCIAFGMSRKLLANKSKGGQLDLGVADSRKAVGKILSYIRQEDIKYLNIVTTKGAKLR